jgi:hypothetical protein
MRNSDAALNARVTVTEAGFAESSDGFEEIGLGIKDVLGTVEVLVKGCETVMLR